MPKLTRLVLRTGASAASLGAFAMSKAAELMRGLAEEGQSSPARDRSDGAAPQRDRSDGATPSRDRSDRATPLRDRSDGAGPSAPKPQARKLEPVIAPEKVPANPAAPAGGDPQGTSGTGPVPRRISNPKAARKVRKRAETTSAAKRLEARTRAKGAKPGTTSKAEATPAELAEAGKGRQPAPMGSSGD